MKKWFVVILLLLVIAVLNGGAIAEPADLEIDSEKAEVDIVDEEDDAIVEVEDLILNEDVTFIDANDLVLDIYAEEPAMSNAAILVNSEDEFEIINGILVKYNGEGGEVVIPDGVTAIADYVFSEYDDDEVQPRPRITSVIIPNSVKSIGAGAFHGCTDLKDITIPDGVTYIGEHVFEASGITSITIPGSIETIPQSAFSGCGNLTSILISEGVKEIEIWAFDYCASLTKLIIPNSVHSIGQGAFEGCIKLKRVKIPSAYLGYLSFRGCKNLATVIIGNNVGSHAFENCISLTNVTLLKGVEAISDWSFAGCSSLKSIVFPKSLYSIGESAFRNCYYLNDVTIKNSNIAVAKAAFMNCPTNIIMHTPCESETTKWAESNGYTVDKSDHIPVTDPAVLPTYDKTGLTEGQHCSVCGKVLVAQEIVPKQSRINIVDCKVTMKDQIYTGKALTPTPEAKYGRTVLKKDEDYTVAYKNNKAIGTATVTLKGKGKYTGTVNETFRILPKSVMLSSLSAGKGTITVKWKKGGNITGYQLQYSLKKSFASKKTVTVAKAATTKAVIRKLKSKKTYYVRIRTYKTVKGKKYYSAWSKAKTVKVK